MFQKTPSFFLVKWMLLLNPYFLRVSFISLTNVLLILPSHKLSLMLSTEVTSQCDIYCGKEDAIITENYIWLISHAIFYYWKTDMLYKKDCIWIFNAYFILSSAFSTFFDEYRIAVFFILKNTNAFKKQCRFNVHFILSKEGYYFHCI